MEQVSRFKGTYPDVPLPADVDLEALGAAEFVTLPVGRVNATSRGGRIYRRPAIESLVRQINEKRPEGRWGHLAVNEISTRYDPPAIRWLAAVLDDEGIAWAKGIPLTEQAREHFRIARATNARVGTSIFGPPPVARGNEVIDLELFSIDIADPARVGIPDTAALPQLTSEMEPEMGDVSEQMLNEMKTERDSALQKAGALEARVSEMQGQLDEYQRAKQVLAEMADSFVTMGISINASGPDLPTVVREMIAKLTALQGDRLVTQIEGAVGEMVALEDLRPMVSEMLIDEDGDGGRRPLVRSVDEAKARITAWLAKPTTKALAAKLVSEQAGPGAIVGGSNNRAGGSDWRDAYVAQAEEMAKARGVR